MMAMNRAAQIENLQATPQWDVLVIGGGATGLGAVLDAASRGYKALLVERGDFAKGTSSRSTKLIHGGVRYLEQGNIKLVQGALHERWYFLKNAPGLTSVIPFILPAYSRWKLFYFWIGLKLYDLLSGRLSLGSTRVLSPEEVVQRMPCVRSKDLKGGVMYYDGQFDDSGMCIALAHTAVQHGATALNYCEVQGFLYEQGRICGAQLTDQISGKRYELRASAIVNATGVFADELMTTDDQAHQPLVRPSQGIHLVADTRFFEGDHALLIPRTTDGRVLFAVPWQGKVVIGTTDVQVGAAGEEPVAHEEEIDFIINNFNQYCRGDLSRDDVLSVFAGLRPLVCMNQGKATSQLLRDHTIIVSGSGLVTIIGGKWTTYRKMAKEAVSKAAAVAGLPAHECMTRDIAIQRPPVEANSNAARLHPAYPYTEADVLHAVRHEMAMQLEDVLARRIRLLFLDSQAAVEAAPLAAEVMRAELGETEAWKAAQLKKFLEIARAYEPGGRDLRLMSADF